MAFGPTYSTLKPAHASVRSRRKSRNLMLRLPPFRGLAGSPRRRHVRRRKPRRSGDQVFQFNLQVSPYQVQHVCSLPIPIIPMSLVNLDLSSMTIILYIFNQYLVYLYLQFLFRTRFGNPIGRSYCSECRRAIREF